VKKAGQYAVLALVVALMACGTLLLLHALDRHGLRLINRYGVRTEGVHAYLMALVPFWGAAVLLLVRRAPH
jgi:hypothetical protein